MKRLNRYAHTISGLFAWWWEHAISSRSLINRHILLNEDRTHSKSEILGNPGLSHLSRLDASFCNSDMDMVDDKSFCLAKPVSAEFFLIIYTSAVFEGDHPQYTTVNFSFWLQSKIRWHRFTSIDSLYICTYLPNTPHSKLLCKWYISLIFLSSLCKSQSAQFSSHQLLEYNSNVIEQTSQWLQYFFQK